MKKILAIILAVMMLIPSFAMAENIVKIGVFEPASGDNGAGGKQEILGMQYANKVQPTVMIGDTEYKVELVYADNASSTDKAPSAASELVNQGVSVVLGSYGSGVSIAGSDKFAEAGIPAIGVSCTNPQVTAGNTHYFRICFLDPFQGTVLANYAYNTMGITNAYTLGELGNDYDQGLIKYFTEAFTELGGTVKGDSFTTGTADFTPYITNAQMYGAGVVFAPCSISYATLIIDQAAGQNAELALLAGDTWDSNMVLKAATGTNLNICISTFYQEGGEPEFDEGFKAWLNSDAEAMTNNGGNDIIAAVSAMGYDAYFVALEALKAAGSTDAKAVNDALWTTTYKGVSGAIAFEPVNGDAVRDTAYIKTIDTATGAWQFVGVQGVE